MVVLYFDVQRVLMRYFTVEEEGTEKIRLKRKLILKVTFLNVRNQIYKKKNVVSTVRGFCTRSNSRFLWLKIKLPYLSFSAISKHLLLYFVPQKEEYEKREKIMLVNETGTV